MYLVTIQNYVFESSGTQKTLTESETLIRMTGENSKEGNIIYIVPGTPHGE